MIKIKAVLFDNDGVLAHTERYWFDANCKTLASMNIPYTRDDFIKHTFTEGWGTAGWLRRQGYGEEIIQNFNEQRDALWKRTITSANVTDPHAVDVLLILKEKYKLAVVTNTGSEDFKLLHWNAGQLLTLFDVMVLREQYKLPKPDPDAYLTAINTLKLLPSEVVVVEDSPRGITSARRAGVSVIAIRNPDFPDLDLSEAQYEIFSLTELPTLISEM